MKYIVIVKIKTHLRLYVYKTTTYTVCKKQRCGTWMPLYTPHRAVAANLTCTGGGTSKHAPQQETWLEANGATNTLTETNIFAPENRLGPKRKRSYSNHPWNTIVSFSGAMLVSGRVHCWSLLFVSIIKWDQGVLHKNRMISTDLFKS